MPDGAVNPDALTATGWERANALVGLFDPAGGASPRLPLAKISVGVNGFDARLLALREVVARSHQLSRRS